MPKIIVAIDGYSSCGKSTTAKLVAKELNYPYIDTGAMYRALTLFFVQNHITTSNPKEIEATLKDIHITFRRHGETGKNDTYLNGLNVEEEIRKMYISEKVSEISAIPAVRRELVAQQQKMGKTKGMVLDGRDIGTVVFPNAELKIFMTADPTIRAQRRQKELLDKGEIVGLEKILENLKSRDFNDTNRSEGPLKQANDAFYLDNSFMTLDEQVELVTSLADEQIAISLRKRDALGK